MLTQCCLIPLCCLTLAAANVRAELSGPPAEVVREGVAVLDKVFWSDAIAIWLDRPGDDLRGHVEGRINPPWWSAANAVETLVDLMDATGTGDHDDALIRMHRINRDPASRIPLALKELEKRGQALPKDAQKDRKQPGSREHTEFRNEYLDDSGWWGVAWLRAYERTKNPDFLASAKAVQAHMAAHWKQDGGGVMWCTEPDKQKTNSITNSLFLMLSADLARLDPTPDPEMKAWAKRSHAWLVEQKVFDGTGVVDGPGHRGDYWSYNQGAYLAGLVAYAELTGSPGDAEEVAKVAEAILTRGGFVREDGILIERLGTSGWDGCLFKGIMARHLRQTCDFLSARHLHPETVARIDRCLNETARAILALDKGKDGLFPAEWHPGAKNQEHNFNTHLSALTALVAAMPGK